MLTRDLLVEVLSRADESGRPGLGREDAAHVADDCLQMFAAEADQIRREILRVAAERISPSDAQQIFAGAPWDMGFHDGKAVAADALRLMARQF